MTPPPNPALAELAAALGEDNVRSLVRTFLRDFPTSVQTLATSPERKQKHRIAHSLKGNSRLMGGLQLSARMAALEARLAVEGGADVTPEDLMQVLAEFEELAEPLRAFAGS